MSRCHFALRKPAPSEELPVSAEVLIDRLQTAPSLAACVSLLEERSEELQAIRRRVFQVLHQRLNAKEILGKNQLAAQQTKLLAFLNEFRAWCDSPVDELELYSLICELRRNSVIRRNDTYSNEIVRHCTELRRLIKDRLLREDCKDVALLAKFVCTTARDGSYDNAVFEKLRSLEDSLPKESIISLLHTFSKLAPEQRRYIYSYCYRLCSRLQVETLSRIERAYVFRFLCQLDLERNSLYKRQVRLIPELVEALLTDNVNLSDLELLNYFEGSKHRTHNEPHLTIELDPSREYSIEVCRAALTATNLDLVMSQEHRERLTEAVWKDFSSESTQKVGVLQTCLQLFGEKAAPIFIRKLKNLAYVKDESVRLLLACTKQIDLTDVFRVSLQKQLIRTTGPLLPSDMDVVVLYDMYLRHIEKYPLQRVSTELQQQIQEHIRQKLDKLEACSNKIVVKKNLVTYFSKVSPSDNSFLRDVDRRILEVYRNVTLKRFDKLEIQLKAIKPALLIDATFNDEDIGYVKTIYASLKERTPELFELLWNQAFSRQETRQKIFFVLCTEKRVAASIHAQEHVKKQSIVHAATDFLKESLSVRSIVLLYGYAGCPLVNPSEILDAVEHNIGDLAILSKLQTESNIQLLVFYLNKAAKEDRTLAKRCIEPVVRLLNQIIHPRQLSSSDKPWLNKLVLTLVLNAHYHNQLLPLSQHQRRLLEEVMHKYAIQILANPKHNNRDIYSALFLLELHSLGYKLIHSNQLLEALQSFQTGPVDYTCFHRKSLVQLQPSLTDSLIRLS